MMLYSANSFTVTPAEAGAQSAVCLRYEGLGPGLSMEIPERGRRDDGDGFENADKNINPSICVPSQAKTPQTAIQMRGFNS